jgi:hypothetical protein
MATCLFRACDDVRGFDTYGRLDRVTNRAFVEKDGYCFLGSQTGGAEMRRLDL